VSKTAGPPLMVQPADAGGQAATPAAHPRLLLTPAPRPAAAAVVGADFKGELHKLNKSLVFLYIELLHVLVEQPSARVPATTNVINTLQNMMHLANLLRPYQARAARQHAPLGAAWLLRHRDPVHDARRCARMRGACRLP